METFDTTLMRAIKVSVVEDVVAVGAEEEGEDEALAVVGAPEDVAIAGGVEEVDPQVEAVETLTSIFKL